MPEGEVSKQRLIKNKAGENSTKVLNEPEMALSLEQDGFSSPSIVKG